jgi:hypothetical protein
MINCSEVKMSCRTLHWVILFLLLFFAGMSAGLAAKQTTADPATIVQNIVQAYGGHAALKAVKAIRHSGTIKSYRLQQTGTLERLLVLPGSLRVDLNYPDGRSEQRITTPDGAWRDGKPATTPMHMAMELQSARFRLPLLLTQGPVRLLGETEGLLHLEMELKGVTRIEVFVDPHSWRIMRSVGHMPMGRMNMSFSADYSDFRTVDGVLFAHKEELTAMGMQTGSVVLERIELNPEFNADIFTLPLEQQSI